MKQGSQEWLEARAGSLGASQIADATAKTKSGPAASRRNVIAKLVTERLTGAPAETYCSKEMEWGTAQEENARACYEFLTGHSVDLVGIVKHPEIEGTHASPDGLVGDDGLVEIKAPNTATHIFDHVLKGKAPNKYVKQIQWQLACTNRQWCDFVSYDPRLPVHLQTFIVRVERDDKLITEIEEAVTGLLAEVDETVKALEKL
jgi:putative phage-type endonuclease